MQAVHTFILRLLVNPETPGELHGSVQTIPEREVYSFKAGPDLLEILEQLVQTQAGDLRSISPGSNNSSSNRLGNVPP
jgi:hypothetical protein